MEQSFYCEKCEMSCDVSVPSLGSHGFEIECPNCGKKGTLKK